MDGYISFVLIMETIDIIVFEVKIGNGFFFLAVNKSWGEHFIVGEGEIRHSRIF
jgi:hypothetical protein